MSIAPYEDLYRYHENPFEHETKLLSLAEYASSLGIRNFKKLYKSYIDTITKTGGAVFHAGSVTMFSGQPLELDTGEWYAGDDGISRRSGMINEVACYHPILPVERLVNIDTGEEKLRLAFRKGSNWRTLIVSKVILANANKVTELAGCGVAVTSQNSRAFVQYISDVENLNYDLIPEKKSIGRLGYIQGEGFSPYVDGLIFDGDVAFRSAFASVHSYGSYEEWIKIAAEVRDMSVTARVVLAASFASVLLDPLNCLPFFVHLWGVDSGTGKTVALMLAASVWADPTVGMYIKTFDSTVVGLEKTAAFLNNLPLCLDELQLAKDAKGRNNFDVYKLAQGVGRTRGNKSGGVDLTPTWRNCILTTGESPLSGQSAGAGAINRVIDIECQSSQIVVTDGMRIASTVRRNFGFAGKDFVEHLYADGVIESITVRYNEIFRSLSDRDTTEKQAMAAAAIVLADELVCEWIFGGNEKPLTIDQVSSFLASRSAVSAGARAYNFLCDWVAQNANKLSGAEDNNERYGTIEDGRAYIIRSKFDKTLSEEGYSAVAVLSYLKQNHLIETRGRANTKSKRIGGIRTECICLVLPTVDDDEPNDLPL